ncbi:glycoside hydrolase family 2 TIM barrel-domain containing protein [Sphingobacterium faecium]|uniref:glycoside hydrolase family 2 TIM barrel-domain containing protein n=1 Tax=Sphingobacterium faecium TaxID=34087 RepID=UPI003DA2226C
MKHFLLLFFSFMIFCSGHAQNRTEILLDKNWKFSRAEDSTFTEPTFDDKKWQPVRIPHDWAIYGPFSSTNDKQVMAIAQDGQKEALEHAGRTGGLPFVGVGQYRTRFKSSEFTKGKRAQLVFDGAMSNAQVYINGRKVGYWPYGYNTFHFDVTEFLYSDGAENTLAVHLENLPQSSRWYPGAGLYRNVHLIITDDIHIPVWGTQVTTPVIKEEYAQVQIKTKIRTGNAQMSSYTLKTVILNAKGDTVGRISTDLSAYDDQIFTQEIRVDHPALWDIDHPHLYRAVSELYGDAQLKDEVETPFGIRSMAIIPDQGFFLNGKRLKFQGVCNHHDLGPLGAAVNEAAIRRQVRLMKDMGANAIRTSHHMPAPELVRICNEMGMMLMIETFDEWKIPKMSNGYNRYFDEWAEKDLVNVIHHYRNNPSVVMWCIGNEVEEQSVKTGGQVSRFLQDICHREDPTRPVTNGMDRPDGVLFNGMAASIDVAGFNYRPHRYQEEYERLPQQIILGTETASTLSSRGIYKFPVQRRSMAKYDDHQASSYDMEHCGWSNLPEDDFIQHEDLPYTIGEFVWTGFDYLGEPTPYYTDWPSHSSLFGIVDLAGIPKDRYYLYRSHWNKTANTLHILPHWTFPGREGQVTPVFAYTNYPTAELFINGKSQGKISKDTSVTLFNSNDKTVDRQKRYRLMWMDCKYEPGTIKVVAYDEDGHVAAEEVVHTAGKAHRIQLKADRKNLKADGKDLSFIEVSMVDKDGNLCPDETREIQFNVTGSGQFKAVANGNPASLESFQSPFMKLFSGRLTAIVESAEHRGKIIFEASAKGVKSAKLELVSE